MSYILTSSSGGGIATPVSIANGGTGQNNAVDGLTALVVGSGAPNQNSTKSLSAPNWGDPLVPTGDPTFDINEIVLFLTNLGVCNA